MKNKFQEVRIRCQYPVVVSPNRANVPENLLSLYRIGPVGQYIGSLPSLLIKVSSPYIAPSFPTPPYTEDALNR